MGGNARARHCLSRYGALVAARVIAHRSMFGYRPPNISHAYNAQPCTKFRLSQLLAWREAIALTALYSGAGLDRLRLVSARHSSSVISTPANLSSIASISSTRGAFATP
jgi:hypothetical protein